jgi:hypothetical protein
MAASFAALGGQPSPRTDVRARQAKNLRARVMGKGFYPKSLITSLCGAPLRETDSVVGQKMTFRLPGRRERALASRKSLQGGS